MTVEQLLELSADELEAMTDEQLIAHLRGYFPMTRPTSDMVQLDVDPRVAEAMKRLKQEQTSRIVPKKKA